MTLLTRATPGVYFWTVPAGFTAFIAELWGAAGGDNIDGTQTGGFGGYIKVDLSAYMSVGDVISFTVGSLGESGTPGTTLSSYGQSSASAWGEGGLSDGDAGAGGGYTAISNATTNQLLAIAGGGGGAGANTEVPANPPSVMASLPPATTLVGDGGHGGYPTGTAGAATAVGTGGSQTTHGVFDYMRRNSHAEGGSQSQPRPGATVGNGYRAGGAGGGGYKGGGSGAALSVIDFGGTWTTDFGNESGQGGGGGSSWAIASLLDDDTGVRAGDGLLIADYIATPTGSWGYGLSFGARGSGWNLG